MSVMAMTTTTMSISRAGATEARLGLGRPSAAAAVSRGFLAGDTTAKIWSKRVALGKGGVRKGAAARGALVVLAAGKDDRPVVIIDNYDSFTYNLSQVHTTSTRTFLTCHIPMDIKVRASCLSSFFFFFFWSPAPVSRRGKRTKKKKKIFLL